MRLDERRAAGAACRSDAVAPDARGVPGVLLVCAGRRSSADLEGLWDELAGAARAWAAGRATVVGAAVAGAPPASPALPTEVPVVRACAGVPDDVERAVGELAAAGAACLVVAGAFLSAGEVWGSVVDRARAAARRQGLGAVVAARPPLSGAEGVRDLARVLAEALPQEEGRAVALVCHGTRDAGCDLGPLALAGALAELGRHDVLLGTLADGGSVVRVLGALRERGLDRVLLVPLVMAMGTHARRDVLGTGPLSWRSRLAAAGVHVEAPPAWSGVAALPGARRLLADGLVAALGACAVRREGTCAAGPGLDADPVTRAVASTLASGPDASRFPLFVSLAGANCLVVGCGAVGSRRARALLGAGARVTVVDPSPAVRPPDGCEVVPRAYVAGDEAGRRLVVAAASDRDANRRVGEACRAAGIPVSVADARGECTFAFPAIAEASGLVAGVASRDDDHALVARAAREVRRVLAQAGEGASSGA